MVTKHQQPLQPRHVIEEVYEDEEEGVPVEYRSDGASDGSRGDPARDPAQGHRSGQEDATDDDGSEEDDDEAYDDDDVYDEDPFAQVLLSADGESIPDVLKGIQASIDALTAVLDKQSRIMYKIATHLQSSA
jgi:hypothetical protein